MSTGDQIQSRKQILEGFNRRRNREMLAMIPFTAGIFAIVFAFEEPDFHVGPLSGVPLLLAALVVVAACLVHHVMNWRCPACQKGLRWGLSIPLCPSCGAVFQPIQEEACVDRAELIRQQEEGAIAKQVGLYRGKYALQLIRALGVIVLGLVLTFFMAEDIKVPAPGSWIGQTFGPNGNEIAARAFGVGVTLLGILWLGYAIRRLTVGARRYAEETRLFLESKRAGLS